MALEIDSASQPSGVDVEQLVRTVAAILEQSRIAQAFELQADEPATPLAPVPLRLHRID
jgi:hypothetical protein